MSQSGCPEVERLGRLLAGEMPAGERDQVSAHLEGCPYCQERVEQLLADDSVLTWRRTMEARTAPGPPDAFLSSMQRLVPLVATSAVTLAEPDGTPATDAARH